jgi:hypothetical protein
MGYFNMLEKILLQDIKQGGRRGKIGGAYTANRIL